jgi:hypothetical protein
VTEPASRFSRVLSLAPHLHPPPAGKNSIPRTLLSFSGASKAAADLGTLPRSRENSYSSVSVTGFSALSIVEQAR